MARINFEDELPIDQDYREPRRRKYKKRRSKKGRIKRECCLLFFILVIFLLIILTAIIAKTGAIEIPVFSKIFYRMPHPTRPVEVENFISPSFIPESIEENSITIKISEADLSLLFRQALSGKKDSPFAENIQVAIMEDHIEFYGLLVKPISANITLKLQLELVDDKLNFKLIKAQIGSLTIPITLANWLVDKLLQEKLEAVSQSIAQAGKIQDLKLSEGELTIISQLK